MRIAIDDWKFITPVAEGCIVAANLNLDNAQTARIEVYPMIYANVGGEVIPEIAVLCELPGESVNSENPVRRWIARPPDDSCEWSKDDMSDTFIRQVNQKIDEIFAEPQEE